jgi:hypothetical protein
MSVSVYWKLTKLGINLYSRENKLLWEAPKGVVTPTILAELKAHKDSLLELLTMGTAARSGRVPASYVQERIWVLAQLGYSRLYHLPLIFSIAGRLNVRALQAAMDHVVARHESLRTGFRQLEGEVVQVVDGAARVEIEGHDLRGVGPEERQRGTDGVVHEIIQRAFDLERAPLVRAALVQTDDDRSVFVVCLHHIVCDGWSTGILTRELSECYAAYDEGRPPTLDPLSVQYPDYAAWQRRVLAGDGLELDLEYWRSHLRGVQDLDLPTDFVRPRHMSGAGGMVQRVVAAEEAGRWRRACRDAQVTLYTLFLAGAYTVLRRHSRQTDICLGTVTAGRNHLRIEDVVGCFVNTLVVRFAAGQITGRDLLLLARGEIADVQGHQNVPFEKIVAAMDGPRDPASNPIFQVLVNYVNTPSHPLACGACRVEPVAPPESGAKFDLTFALADRPDGSLGVTMEYSRDLYEREN